MMGVTTRVIWLGVIGVLEAGRGAAGQTLDPDTQECRSSICNCCCWDSVQGRPTTLSQGRPACIATELGLLPCCNPAELTPPPPGAVTASTASIATTSTSSTTTTTTTTTTVEPTTQEAAEPTDESQATTALGSSAITAKGIGEDRMGNPDGKGGVHPNPHSGAGPGDRGKVSYKGGDGSEAHLNGGPPGSLNFFLKGSAPGGKAGKSERGSKNENGAGGMNAGGKNAGAKIGKMDGSAILAAAAGTSKVGNSEGSSTTAAVLVMMGAVAGIGLFSYQHRKLKGYTDTKQPLLAGYDVQIAAPGTAPQEPRFSVLNTYTVRAEAAATANKRRSPERNTMA